LSEADWADVEPTFQQLGVINGMRNDILHHGASAIAEGFGIVTNAEMALSADRVTSFAISADILNKMTADLRKIIIHLHASHMGRPPLRGKHQEIDAILLEPWQYKPQPLHRASMPRPGKRGQPKGKSQKGPPKSSGR